MGGGFYVREQKYICGKDYATAPTMQAEFFEVSEKEHKASTRRKKELATSDGECHTLLSFRNLAAISFCW